MGGVTPTVISWSTMPTEPLFSQQQDGGWSACERRI